MAEKRAAAAKKAETAEKNAKDLLRDQDEGVYLFPMRTCSCSDRVLTMIFTRSWVRIRV